MKAFQLLTAALVLMIGIDTCLGMKEKYSETVTDTFSGYVVKSFGMSAGGTIEIDYNINNHSSASYIVLVGVTENQRQGWYDGVGNNNNVDTICNQPSLHRTMLSSTGSFVWKTEYSSEYSLIVMQCRSSGHAVSISINADMKNVLSDGSEGYLAVQDLMLVRLFQGEVLVYALLLVGLIGQYYFRGPWMKEIHSLFFVTLVCALASSAAYYTLVASANQSGSFSDSSRRIANLLNFLFTLSSLGTMLLLSLGWSTLRAFLSTKERNLISSTLVAYFIIGLSDSFCLADTLACGSLSLTEYVIRCILYLEIIIALNFTVTQLRITLLHSPWVSTLSVQYARSKQFQMFRLVFVLYLLLPTFMLLVETTIFSWKEDWMNEVINDLLEIFLIFHVGVTFSPMNEVAVTRAFGTFNNPL